VQGLAGQSAQTVVLPTLERERGAEREVPHA
jgi:hypothetical protein